MKRVMIWLAAFSLLAACDKTPVAQVSATFENAKDSTVVLQKLNYNRLVPVDTIKTDAAGRIHRKIKLTGNDPYFYYFYLGGNPVASLILRPSDKVTLTVPASGPFVVEGSEESTLFQQVNNDFAAAAADLSALSSSVDEQSSEAEIKAANSRISKRYIDYKREAIKHVITHPRSITSAVVLFQKFSDDLPVFGQESDAVIFQSTLDSLSKVYPKSEYVLALRDEVDARRKSLELSNRLGEAYEIGFPDLVLPDVDGNTRMLSDLNGKVILVSFWSVGQTEHKMLNVDLMDLYRKYHDQGLEIYQVSLDIDKPSWAATVRSQGLPWISVNDGYGVESPSVAAYNIVKIPTLYVIDRKGDIVASDVFEKDALESVIRKNL
jgi:peroxiredoxin